MTIPVNKILLPLLFVFYSTSLFAQDNSANELKVLLDKKQYDKIIELYSTNGNFYTANELYCVGLSYYMKEEDLNCIKLMDLSITKDPKYAKAHYIKGSTLNYMKRYEEAITSFQSAINLNPKNADYYSGLGDSYYYLLKNDLALESFINATKQADVADRPFSMIAQIYSDKKNDDKALEAYYIAKSNISKKSDAYINVLFNIGLIESLKGNYEKAEPAFLELLQLSPDDFHTYAKLIQIYYHQKNYEKAKPYKTKLYEAHNNSLLKGNLEDMFCFDQFKWNGKLIQAFERYENNSKKGIYNKQIFYVLNPEGKIDLTIQTEYSPISVEQGGPKYLICMSKGNVHATFGIGFNDSFLYDDLKKSVLDVLQEKIKPAASSQPNN